MCHNGQWEPWRNLEDANILGVYQCPSRQNAIFHSGAQVWRLRNLLVISGPPIEDGSVTSNFLLEILKSKFRRYSHFDQIHDIERVLNERLNF